MARKKLKPPVREMVLLESGYMCGNPACRHILTLELHHIVWVKEGGDDEPSNLIALCPNCHSLHTHGHIPGEAIEVWKGMLHSLNNPNRANADILLLLHREGSDPDAKPLRFTADGLLLMAGLLSSGLVEIGFRNLGFGYYGATVPTFGVSLTDRGRQLVKAWLEGKRSHVGAAIGHASATEVT